MPEKLEPNPDGFFSIQDEWSGEENVTCTYTFHEYFIPDEAWEGGSLDRMTGIRAARKGVIKLFLQLICFCSRQRRLRRLCASSDKTPAYGVRLR